VAIGGRVLDDEGRVCAGAVYDRELSGLRGCSAIVSVLGDSVSSCIVASTNPGYWLRIISYCSLTKVAFRSISVKEAEQVTRLRRTRGME
jgi:hypothetical protein